MNKDNLKVVAIVECRMTSSRLPGKILLESMGQPMLALLVARLRQVKRIDEIVLATTVNATDDCVEQLAQKLQVGCSRGSEDDVLKRVLDAAEDANAGIIVEVTGDCPLLDPDIVDQVLALYLHNDCDFAANNLVSSYPLGMDTRVFSTESLALCDREGLTPDDREHVSWFLMRNSERFRLLNLPAPQSLFWPELRVTLDEKEDFELINVVNTALFDENPTFSCLDLIHFLRKNPDLYELNSHIQQRHPTS